MHRCSQKIARTAQLTAWQNIRQSSSGQTSKSKYGAGTGVAVATTGGAVGFMGIMGYAAWSDENRKVIDHTIPGAQYVTDSLLGRVPTTPKPSPPVYVPPKPVFKEPPPQRAPSKQASVKDTSSEKGSQNEAAGKQTMDMEKKKDRAELAKQDESAMQASPAPPLTAPPPSPSATDTAAPSKEGRSSPPLLDLIQAASKGVTAALSAAEEAAAVVQKQSAVAIQSLERGELDDAVKASVASAVSTAEQAFKQAQIRVTELATGIACTKSAGAGDSSLGAAEEAITELGPAIVKVKDVISDSLNTMVNIEVLCGALQEARTKLSAELKEVFPNVSSLDAEKQLQLMLGYAYNKITAMQKQIQDKQKVLDEIRKRGPIEGGSGGVSEALLQAELDKLRHQLTLQHRSDLGRQQEELESEVRGQLKRQAAAHAEHLGDELGRQELELAAHWQLKLFDELNKEKDRQFKEIASIRGRLLGLQSVVSARADADKAARAARQLWLACQALRNTLRLGRENASTWDEQLQPLQPHLTAIAVAGGDNLFVSAVVGTVSSVAAERGVYTEEALRHRFARVDTVAKRVAMVPENGASLLRYLLSYVQSVLLIQASSSPSDEQLLDKPVNIHDLSTFDILDRARSCLTADDLLGCVRWLNQLTGESRRVAEDWRQEARRTLELRQVADALMAHAAATTATAV